MPKQMNFSNAYPIKKKGNARLLLLTKRYVPVFFSVLFAMSLYNCTGGVERKKEEGSQALIDRMSDDLKVHIQVIDNSAGEDESLNAEALGAAWGAVSKLLITLTNTGAAIDSKDWEIYFHTIRPILKSNNDHFKIERITGDLHRITPTMSFDGFKTNEKIEIPVFAEYWFIVDSDLLPRWYVTSGSAKPKVIKNTDTENIHDFITPISLKSNNWKRPDGDQNVLMTPVSRYAVNADLSILPLGSLRGRIIPTPLNQKIHAEDVNLSSGIDLSIEGLNEASVNVIKDRCKSLGLNLTTGTYPVKVTVSTKVPKKVATSGGYALSINKKETKIIGYDELGAFYGLQSFLSLVPPKGDPMIATMAVEDAPRYGYRSLMLDVARNFHSKEAVLKLLDQMSFYKLNVFHFHLSDDEGWRIEIPGIPELTEIGGKRGHDLTETTSLLPQLGSGPYSDNMGSGFFTRNDYIEIVKYAKARQIDVIPEIDMPGHSRAAVVSMEARYRKLMKEGKEQEASQYRLLDPEDKSNVTTAQFYDRRAFINPAMPSSLEFVGKVIKEIAGMHQEAGAPLIAWHYGGDEASNIRLNSYYQDFTAQPKEKKKGIIDKSMEDEPFAKSPAAQAFVRERKVGSIEEMSSYFAKEVAKLVNDNNIPLFLAWQDGLLHFKSASDLPTAGGTGVSFWENLIWGGEKAANKWVDKGFKAIIASPDFVYLDMLYEVTPREKGYYWATNFNSERKAFSFAPNNLPQNGEILTDTKGIPVTLSAEGAWKGGYGLQTSLFSEVIRTDERMFYMLFPRLLSTAERAWHRSDWEMDYKPGLSFKKDSTNHVNKTALNKEWNLFSNLLSQRELEKLDKEEIPYRLPVPGAIIQNNQLEANVALPGLTIEYSTDNGNNWIKYDVANKPAIQSESVLIRSVSPDGKRSSRAEALLE